MTAGLFSIGKYLIGLYLGTSGVASAYGAAGSVVVLLVWVYYSAQIVLLGAEFTRAYVERFGGPRPKVSPHATKDPHARGDRGEDGGGGAGGEGVGGKAVGWTAHCHPEERKRRGILTRSSSAGEDPSLRSG